MFPRLSLSLFSLLGSAKVYEMSSFGEATARKYAKKEPAEFVEYNTRQLIRIYPAGTRVNSSNYNPAVMWKYGCQLVALNFQTPDIPMQLNRGKFKQNGRSGYILKPHMLRQTFASFDPMHISSKKDEPVNYTRLRVTIISAQQLPKPGRSRKGEIIDPYVEVELYGAHNDLYKKRTKTIVNNGFNPLWNEVFDFCLFPKELCMIRFVVNDEDVGGFDFIACYSLPCDSLAPGYRHIPLELATGETIDLATLFVHIEMEQETGPLFTCRLLDETEALQAQLARSNTMTSNSSKSTSILRSSNFTEKTKSNSLGVSGDRDSKSSTSNLAKRGSTSSSSRRNTKNKEEMKNSKDIALVEIQSGGDLEEDDHKKKSKKEKEDKEKEKEEKKKEKEKEKEEKEKEKEKEKEEKKKEKEEKEKEEKEKKEKEKEEKEKEKEEKRKEKEKEKEEKKKEKDDKDDHDEKRTSKKLKDKDDKEDDKEDQEDHDEKKKSKKHKDKEEKEEKDDEPEEKDKNKDRRHSSKDAAKSSETS